MKVIEKISKAQEAQIPAQVEKWMEVATRPIDKTKAENAIVALYALMKEERPLVIFAQSPFQAALMVYVCQQAKTPLFSSDKKNQLRGQLRGQLGGQLRDQLMDQLRGQLWNQLDA